MLVFYILKNTNIRYLIYQPITAALNLTLFILFHDLQTGWTIALFVQ